MGPASDGEQSSFDPGLVCRLAARDARVQALARLRSEAGLSARETVEARPAVARPDHARQHVLRHPRHAFEAAAVVAELDAAPVGDPAG